MIRKVKYILITIALTGTLLSCEPPSARNNSKLSVVTTTGLIADVVRNIGDTAVEVVALMGPGVDPHLYKASHGDVRKISAADILFYNGLHLEGKMGSVFEKTGSSKNVVAVTRDIPEYLLRKVGTGVLAHDPHIWFDVSLWQHVAATVKRELQKADSVNAMYYERNYRKYQRSLDSLDRAVRAAILSIPESQRVLITAHDAFGYFGDAYGIEVRGLQGISTIAEFGLKDVTTLVDYIIKRRIKAIFVETSVSERSIRAIIEGCSKKGCDVVIGGSLYSDALGSPESGAGTYIGMFNANINTIVTSLK